MPDPRAQPAIARLDFTLPHFRRIAWVNDRARLAWASAIEEIERAAPRISALARQEVPACCREFREAIPFTDPTLPAAFNTPGAVTADRIVTLPEGALNTLLAPLGLTPLRHRPCSMLCEPSRGLASEWLALGRANGFEREVAALEEILSWPVEWSALHGIAEIRIPVLKLSTDTDATPETYRVRISSRRYPVEAPSGLNFPYSQPQTHSRRAPAADRLIEIPAPAPVNPPHRMLAQRPRSSRILDETFARIRSLTPGPLPGIESIYLSNYFTAVQLEDRSVGAAANYCRFKSEEAIAKSLAELEEMRRADPLLSAWLFPDGEPDLLQLSVKTSLVSALSRQLLLEPSGFQMREAFDLALLPDVRSAVVVGFGGYLDYIIRRTQTRRIHVSDFTYRRRARRIDAHIEHYRGRFPDKTISVSDGSDTKERLADADLVSITASALCSGTMEELLEAAGNCGSIIVQGQSGAVYPQVLFERGVTTLSTTVKPENLMDLARADRESFRAQLEGGLRPVYFMPL